MTKLTFSRSVILAGLLSFAALPTLTYAATPGPGGGAPVPIGQSGKLIAFGPGGGAPVPIGQSGKLIAFGPGGGAPVPIGKSGKLIAFGPGGGAPVPIGRDTV